MESIDYWEDSQYDSLIDFDDSMNMVVRDSIGIGAEAADAVIEASGDRIEVIVKDFSEGVTEETVDDSADEMACIVEDSFCDDGGDKKLEPLVDFRRVKTRVSDSRPKVIHDFDLNELSSEEKVLAAKYKGERDFNLNKLPIAGPKS